MYFIALLINLKYTLQIFHMILKFNLVTRYSMRLKNFYLAFMSVFALEIVSSNENGIDLDGVLTQDEWNQSTEFDLEYELMPSRQVSRNALTCSGSRVMWSALPSLTSRLVVDHWKLLLNLMP